ncbi:hypothetical protein [Natranaerobius thermophilus]|uniref:Uncharacterized protein n=1 Tax=Natranaerobius thermophilus (strain ATCC BAA-1301 / DSM 18059 / JW/NM-WN-LF) TaxID=457570 RepID=B2A3Z3_NATTJ|nr:hypothetical protein [Natranaerobius thermophilus]ACB85095.1 hypothetical protein Nther_1514 [Natranaerobius thermophilus JW/NM-WN-LF]
MTIIKFNLIENSMDSFEESINYYIKGKEYNDSRQYKYCILLLHHSAELLLKEVLRQQHDSLIFEDIDKINENNTYDKTINFSQALKRMKNACKIELEQRYLQYLDDLSKYRNRIQHYEFTIEHEYAKRIVINSFITIKYILKNILGESFEDYDGIVSLESLKELEQDKDYLQKYRKDVNNEIKRKQMEVLRLEYAPEKFLKIPCPNCSEKLLTKSNDNTIECRFCFSDYEDRNVLFGEDEMLIIRDTILRELKRRMIDINLKICPTCDYESLLYIPYKEVWECLSCNDEFISWNCDDCGETYPDRYLRLAAIFNGENHDYYSICSDCSESSQYEVLS